MPDTTEILKMLETCGRVKASTDARRMVSGSAAATVQTNYDKVNSIMNNICRAVMRDPDSKLLSQFKLLHACLATVLSDMDDKIIEFIFSSFPDGFRFDTHETVAETIKGFLRKEVDTMSPQHLFVHLKKILMGIGYSFEHQLTTDKPDLFDGVTVEMVRQHQQLKDYFSSYFSESDPSLKNRVWHVYPARRDDIAKTIISGEATTNYRYMNDDDVSSESDVDKPSERRERYLPFIYLRMNKAERLTWVGAAEKGAIPIRYHVSGSVGLTLALIDALFAHSHTGKHYFNDELNIEFIASIFVALYQRAGCHSPAETAAGIKFYVTERHNRHGGDRQQMPMSPKSALDYSLDLLATAASDDKASDETLSLRAAIQAIKPYILSLTNDLPHTNEFPSDEEKDSTLAMLPPSSATL